MSACVFCLSTAGLREEQILLRGRSLYLCAPRGQLVEGFLVLAPYACVSALSRLPRESLAAFERGVAMIESFYLAAYGCRSSIVYEQGRGGGGASLDRDAAFPFHAHLCALPLDVDLQTVLADRFTSVDVDGVADLPAVADGVPYLYVERRGARRGPAVYLPSTQAQHVELERSRLKPSIAALAGMPERGTWREYAGDPELSSLIARFATWRKSAPFGDDDLRDPFGECRDGA